ncbi:Asp23/Gls24 family envelope stress response protein [Nonomuraea sp. K274]|uniref:Asp23/Gls24 family envelope stress response protein n=1 Tax=Nonomuraea cypriaca TaxID=1187855 RepID=A0A931AGT0_9ACTN|nr:Asp23/Gls24 family envelope stress response protein [Nonomuraea cypriaca]MBF8190779.1 Asp23/Gls24 family envelope stress response protein [Nonomuraea cypriaca]
MTDVTPGAGAATVPAQRRPPPPAPERRGRTEVTGQVVMKLATCAAREVPEVRAVHLRGLPWARSSGVDIRGNEAEIHLNVTLGYPAPLRAVAARLREHVMRRVARQTGLNVTRLDVTVEPGTGLGTGPGTGLGTGLGTGPGTGLGTGPGTGLGTGLGTGPGTGLGTGPGTGLGTGLGTGEEEGPA